MIKRISGAACAVVMAVAVTPVSADDHILYEGAVYTINAETHPPEFPVAAAVTDVEIPGSTVVVSTTGLGIEYTLSTSELIPGNAYTIWLIVFNVPQACSDPDTVRGLLCGDGDYLNATLWSIMYGAGAVADAEGDATFTGSRMVGDPDRLLLGPGLLNPNAEAHFIVRDHGPASDDPVMLESQTGTVNGGCTSGDPLGLLGLPGDYECFDPQATGA